MCGAYIGVYFLAHMTAVFAARYAGTDTNWNWLTNNDTTMLVIGCARRGAFSARIPARTIQGDAGALVRWDQNSSLSLGVPSEQITNDVSRPSRVSSASKNQLERLVDFGVTVAALPAVSFGQNSRRVAGPQSDPPP